MPSALPASHNCLPRITPGQWEELRIANIRGVPDIELAEQYGVAASSIRKRRSRDPAWAAACAHRLTPGGAKRRVAPHLVTKPPSLQASADGVERAVTASLDQIAQENPLIMARAMHDRIKQALATGVIDLPSTYQELAIANKLLRTSTGQDKAEGTVTLNLWSGGAGDVFSGGLRDVSEPS